MDKAKVKDALESLRTDLRLAFDPDWYPEDDAEEASMANIQLIADELGIELEDED